MPSHRILSRDPRELALHELLSVLLQPGLGRTRADTAAVRLMCEFAGDGGRGLLREIGSVSPAELRSAGGITPSAAARVAAALEIGRRFAAEPTAERCRITDPAQVHQRFHARLRDLGDTQVWVLVMGARNQLLQETLVSHNPGGAALVHPREVLRPAVREGARALILVHNDPDGPEVPVSSPSDRALTRQLQHAAAIVGLDLWDHVVVGLLGYFSFRAAGLLNPPGTSAPPRRGSPAEGPAAAHAGGQR